MFPVNFPFRLICKTHFINVIDARKIFPFNCTFRSLITPGGRRIHKPGWNGTYPCGYTAPNCPCPNPSAPTPPRPTHGHPHSTTPPPTDSPTRTNTLAAPPPPAAGYATTAAHPASPSPAPTPWIPIWDIRALGRRELDREGGLHTTTTRWQRQTWRRRRCWRIWAGVEVSGERTVGERG